MEATVVADGVAGPLPGRCAYFVERKKRYCKMVAGSGKTYCGEHANSDAGGDRKRIPCPLDPKHTVYEDSLAKHLKKCNSKEKPKPVYFVKDINTGPVCDEDTVSDEVPLADYSAEKMDRLLQKLRQAVKGLNVSHRQSVLSHDALHDALNDPKNGDSALKHLKQQASLLGNMERVCVLGSKRCVVEFGAGRGKLSHWIHAAATQETQDNLHFLLVERSTTRFKVDGKNKGSDCTFERLQVDIQHLDLSKVPLLQDKRLPVVGVGKHLCGGATDLALRCLLERSSSAAAAADDDDDDDDAEEQPASKRLRGEAGHVDLSAWQPRVIGVCIALCCHHRCDWRSYVGQDFFKGRGLGPAEFRAFTRMSSWATCGMTANHRAGQTEGKGVTEGPDKRQVEEEQEEEHEEEEMENIPESLSSMSVQERERIGRLCKRLIDEGRVQYLKSRGQETGLSCYIGDDITLENTLLTAVPEPSL
ncbi:tRNA:m(4)X modification enzyme TRM13 homolog [Engraulis encrasicolus]|uniref:tRNA:m(4)X modification enzyme TRM13 homolog n=1 Tax=Engraulis encrasicolus TaxID=184585 RepID=UPI002FD1B8DA